MNFLEFANKKKNIKRWEYKDGEYFVWLTGQKANGIPLRWQNDDGTRSPVNIIKHYGLKKPKNYDWIWLSIIVLLLIILLLIKIN